MEPLFRVGESVHVAAQPKFSVRENFIPNMEREAPVRIVYVLGNFQKWFMPVVEEASAEVTLEWRELQRNASNPAILKELEAAPIETTLAAVFALMRTQRAGQPGPLANNGWGNVFYVRDVAGERRAVNVHWCDDGWGVEAMWITGITEWPIRDRVFLPV